MLRLQTTKLPAAVSALCQDYVMIAEDFRAEFKNSCSCATAKLFCNIELMLPLGKHAQFGLRYSRPKPGFASFTSVGLTPRKCINFPKENSAERVLNRFSNGKKH